MQDDRGLSLAELLCARLCHDLAGPVGALGAGAELLADGARDDGLEDDAVALLAESAASATARLRFLRLAFGSAGAAVPVAALRDLVAAYVAAPGPARSRLEWSDGQSGDWEPGPAKTMLNLVMLAQDCLPQGGAIRIEARKRDDVVARVTATGIRLVAGPAVAGLAATVPTDLGPRGAQGVYAVRVAAAAGLDVTATETDGAMVFEARTKSV